MITPLVHILNLSQRGCILKIVQSLVCEVIWLVQNCQGLENSTREEHSLAWPDSRRLEVWPRKTRRNERKFGDCIA